MHPLLTAMESFPRHTRFGRVSGVRGLRVDVSGLSDIAGTGVHLGMQTRQGRCIPGEVVGVSGGHLHAMAFEPPDDLGTGCRVDILSDSPVVCPCESWLGRVMDAFANPLDGGGPLPAGEHAFRLRASPPAANSRGRMGGPVSMGVRALNSFATCCEGQRLGIFAGSGVGKSTLMAMMAKNCDADVIVAGLIGERGREAREFIEDDLGPAALARTALVVSTSDESPLKRRHAAHLTMTIAEAFRDAGKHVLLLMDSVTRFAMAMREIGLSAGEPPTAKGYPPSVFSELPRLLERAGPGTGRGSITAFFTVLVDGDDHNEPIADAVRGILDGHVVLERRIAERGRYPAINVLKSVSRAMPACHTPGQTALLSRARACLALYEEMEDLIRLGAYRSGSDPDVDAAIRLQPALEAFLGQDSNEAAGMEETFAALERALAG